MLFDAHSSEHFSYLGSISGTSGLTLDSDGYMTDADGTQYVVKERELYKVSGENYEKIHVVVTDDALAEQIKTLIEPWPLPARRILPSRPAFSRYPAEYCFV